MGANTFSKFVAVATLGVLALTIPVWLRAQARPGPMPAAPSKDEPAKAIPVKKLPPPRQSILGAWRFNPDESDDARKRLRDAQGGGRDSGRTRIGGGYPGSRGGYGRGESDAEREKMLELFHPADRFTLDMTGAEVDLLDDQNRKRAFMTDQRKLQKTKSSTYEEIAAHWDGKMLVSEEKDPHGRKMSRSFELSYDGRQLFETLHMTVGINNVSLVVRSVYDEVEPPDTKPELRK